jgi:anti-sigma regulatory factor (Ser/Thr protein kinase)
MSASTLWKHQITLPAVAASVPRARDFTDCHLREHRLPDLVADVRLVTSELATNSVRHAGTPFRIEMQARDGYVLLTVRDGSLAPRVVRFPSTSAEAGRGLYIVAALSAAWGVSDADDPWGRSVWASFRTDDRPSAATVLHVARFD